MSQLFDERLGLLFVHGMITVVCLRSRIASEKISESNRYDWLQRKKSHYKTICFCWVVQKIHEGSWQSGYVFDKADILYKELGGNGSLVDFLSDICRCLMAAVDIPDNLDDQMSPNAKKVWSVKANDVLDAIQLDKCNHWPIQDTTPQRCKNTACTRRSRFLYSKCQVYLMGKIVFLLFHGIQQA